MMSRYHPHHTYFRFRGPIKLLAHPNSIQFKHAQKIRRDWGLPLRVIHLLLNPGRQRHISPLLPLDPRLFRQQTHAVSARTLHHFARDDDAGVADPLDLGVDEPHADFFAVEAAGERGGGGVDHGVCYSGCLGEDCSEAETREDVSENCQQEIKN